MKFCFWQNIVSIHQAPFLEALAKKHEVVLMVEEQLIESRAKEGWNVPEISGVSISGIPSDKELTQAFADKEIHHIFSGIDAFPGVYRAFRCAVDSRSSISVFLEPYVWNDIKGVLRRCKYFLLHLRYGNAISRLFTTGRNGERCYRRSGFPTDRIYQWGYFTADGGPIPDNLTPNVRPSAIFVGSLDENKNILRLLDCMLRHRHSFERFTIVGRGPLESLIRQQTESVPAISFDGTKPNDEVRRMIASHDFLILPSHYDGWGAVVNEALTAGTRVLCSDRCGAAVLIDDAGVRGRVFPLDKMEQAIIEELQREPLNIPQRREIAEWAHSHISGEVAADYFASCFTPSGNKPVAPWLKTTI